MRMEQKVAPPPPPPPQDEISNKQTRNFIDFIFLLYKKRGSKPSFFYVSLNNVKTYI